MKTLLLEFAIRTTLIAASTAAVLWILRIRTASVRHAAWSAVVVMMLLLPLTLTGGIRLSLPVLEPESTATNQAANNTPSQPGVVAPASEPPVSTSSEAIVGPPRRQAARQIDWTAFAMGAYLAGALMLLMRLVIGTIQANRLRRKALEHAGRLTSDQCTTPITVGWFKPVLILPRGWDRWSPDQLAVVLTHEQEHARRHDPLVQWLALLNRAVFWFHPLAWWLERRLATLAEEACDAAVIAAGHSPQNYSEYLLEMARTVALDGRRVRLGMAMPGFGLQHRLRVILGGLPAVPISRTRIALTTALCAASAATFASGTLVERTNARTMQPAVTQSPTAPQMQIKYEAVAIRQCDTSAQGTGRGGAGNSPRFAITPSYVRWGCVSLAQLIENAWGGAPPDNALLNTLPYRPNADGLKRVRGGPSWVEDEKYEIEIRISGDTTDQTGSIRHNLVNNAMGPALRAMLEDRFKLKVRKMTEERPMYGLSVAPGGHKLKTLENGDCAIWQEGLLPRPSRTGLLDGKWVCGTLVESMPLALQARLKGGEDRSTVLVGMAGSASEQPPAGASQHSTTNAAAYTQERFEVAGPNRRMEAYGLTLQALARSLAGMMDRFVIDKSSTAGTFTFAFEFTANENTPHAGWGVVGGQPDWPSGNSIPAAVGKNQTIFKSLEALGLKLEPTKGPAEYLMIESAQRPAFAPQASAGQATGGAR